MGQKGVRVARVQLGQCKLMHRLGNRVWCNADNICTKVGSSSGFPIIPSSLVQNDLTQLDQLLARKRLLRSADTDGRSSASGLTSSVTATALAGRRRLSDCRQDRLPCGQRAQDCCHSLGPGGGSSPSASVHHNRTRVQSQPRHQKTHRLCSSLACSTLSAS